MKKCYIKPEYKSISFSDFCGEDDGPETISFGTLSPKADFEEDEGTKEGYWGKFDWQ